MLKKKLRAKAGLVLLAAALVMLTMLSFTACGEPKAENLEEYAAAHPEVQEQLEKSAASLGVDVMTIEIGITGNDIDATGTLNDTYGEETLESLIATIEGYGIVIENAARDMVTDLEKDTGFTGISFNIRILNGDGTEVWAEQYRAR